MEHAYVLSKGALVAPRDLPAEILKGCLGGARSALPTLEQVTRDLIARALAHTNGRKIAAASLLGIERRRLNRFIRDLDIDPTNVETSSVSCS